ncbi:MAG: ATP-binding cassette domain-containing protein [Eubacterium sp.]|nr:ATP-binding cassette domain-containing protein [Eubacterium sp.]
MIESIIRTSFILNIIFQALYIVGLWRIFVKCQKKGWWSIIPGYREYELARCADKESDGRVYLFVSIFSLALTIVGNFVDFEHVADNGKTSAYFLLFFIALVITFIAQFVYTIRILSGVLSLFGISKEWIWYVVFVGEVSIILYIGVSKKNPKVIYIDPSQNKGAALSGYKAKSMDSGLTVNIEDRTITDFFKKKALLRDIHMNIEPGHMVLLLGGSGAGKTTFVNAVNGYEKANAEIILNGENLYKEYKKMKYKVGFVPQMDLVRGNDTVERTLYDAAKLRIPVTVSKDERNKRIWSVLQFFGLEPVKDRLCDKLSGGQRKRLSIAMEYISNPDLFILDEPDSGLDGVMARELMEGLRSIADQGKIVMVITHSPDRVIDLFDDVIVLAKDSKLTGRLTYFGPVEEAKTFFDTDLMERIVLRINRKEEGGDGRADEFIEKYAEVCNG